MVTYAQAQERAERWINGDVPAERTRKVRVREFDLGFVAWTEEGREGGGPRLVIAKDSGDATLWPALALGEVIRRYEEEYGVRPHQAPADEDRPAARLDLGATSFLLSPPQWLQDAADRIGAPGERRAAADEPAAERDPAPAQPPAPEPEPPQPPPGTAVRAEWPAPATGADTDSVDLPATVIAPPVVGSGDDPAPPLGQPTVPMPPLAQPTVAMPPLGEPTVAMPPPGQQTVAMPPLVQPTVAMPPPGQPTVPVPGEEPAADAGFDVGAGAADIGDAPTTAADRVPPPPPPGPPAPPAQPKAAAYVPTQVVQALPGGGAVPPPPPPPPAPRSPRTGDVHQAATMLAQPAQPPQAPPPTPRVPQGGDDVHQAATMLAQPAGPAQPAQPPQAPPPYPSAQAAPPQVPPPPQYPQPPQAPQPGPYPQVPQAPQAPQYPYVPPPPPAPQPPQGGYGYPQPPVGVPTVGPGYMAVLRYRAPDGSEQQIIRRSAPGTPHPEWQILHELRALAVPPQEVLELHTELESCDLPGGYCARMVRETWPQVRVSHTAGYAGDHAGRRQGVAHLLTHQGELHQVAAAPARPAPQRVPMPHPAQIQRVPPIPLDAIGHELAQAFGPQGLFRFDQRAVAREGVPDVVARTLVLAGLPVDFGPFFWALAQPGRPVPTLAELAAERGVQAAPDAGSYLVVGNDYGRQLCVQYGTANIVAVPLEVLPGGAPAQPRFVNSSLPEFARCLALLGRMWRLRLGLTPDQAGRWTVDFQAQLAAQDPAALGSPETWWSVLIEQMWDGLL